MEPIRALAERWLSLDRDPETRAEIEALLASNDEAELERRLRTRIAFGTAGLRSAMRAGFAHMNSLNVLTTSAGLAEYILSLDGPDASAAEGRLGVVIGYDGRHRSSKFARLAAAAFLQKGFVVYWFGALAHTPLVPFAVTRYKASAGVMVTASHNPKDDNGYKVYWRNGSQIIPPHDAGIAAAIAEVEALREEVWDEGLVDRHGNVQRVFEDARAAYLLRLKELVEPDLEVEAVPAFVYTPMHGVGLPFMQDAISTLGIPSTKMHTVTEQAHPDADFPTVAFPNPEESGALDLAIQHARTHHIRLVVANDPDADRFSAAAADPSSSSAASSHDLRQFTGNQLGVLLAAHVLETYPHADKSNLTLLASTVSTRMLAAMAAVEGCHFRETLTGFKWLGNVAQSLQTSGQVPVFAFEEAIGFMFPSVVWDKDGVAAACVFLSACARWRAQGFVSPWAKLQSLYERYGHFADANSYVLSPSPATTKRVFDAIRGPARTGPAYLGSRKITRWRDLTCGFDSASADGTPDLPVDPAAQMLTCALEGDVVFTVRGSGTEPKIKFYIEAQSSSSMAAAGEVAREVRRDLLREWFRVEEYGLRMALGMTT